MNFDQAIDFVLRFEGGYSNHPEDNGGETNFGITEKVARENGYQGQMLALPLDFARRVYREKYWDALKLDQLPAWARLPVFDSAVNSGTHRAAIWLQNAVYAVPDGIIGPRTIALAVNAKPDARGRLLGLRLDFVSRLPDFQHFGAGWARRISAILQSGE